MSEEASPFHHDPLTPAELDRLATLARLTLTGEERSALMRDMEGILRHVDTLGRVQDEPGEPYACNVHGPSELRPDVVAPSLPVDVALASAPERLGDGFGVPKILG